MLRYAAMEIAGDPGIQRSSPADQDVHPELIVETASAWQSMLAQVFQRELPDAAWLQPAVSGFEFPRLRSGFRVRLNFDYAAQRADFAQNDKVGNGMVTTLRKEREGWCALGLERTRKRRGNPRPGSDIIEIRKPRCQSELLLKRKSSATIMPNENNNLPVVFKPQSGTPQQGQLVDLGIEKQVEIDGVGMGVLSDGTPFLTGRGLARLCGITHAQIQRLSVEWIEEADKPRVVAIKQLLSKRGIDVPQSPYVAIAQRSGTFFAYSDAVCLAVLEYYAFDSSEPQQEALKNFRLLAGAALRTFIYTQVGYDPTNAVPHVWKQFHDRLVLTYNSVPHGYFGIFKEMADMIVTLGQVGLHIDDKFVPDISVGTHWAKHWTDNKLSEKFGERIKYEHNYPNYFPQAASNPQEPWCYPNPALAEFRRWMREEYIGEGKFAKYIYSKVKQNELPASFAQLAIAAYTGEE